MLKCESKSMDILASVLHLLPRYFRELTKNSSVVKNNKVYHAFRACGLVRCKTNKNLQNYNGNVLSPIKGESGRRHCFKNERKHEKALVWVNSSHKNGMITK